MKENETVELKKSTSEIKEAVIAISAILNKHGSGELYFGVKNDGAAVGQDISEKREDIERWGSGLRRIYDECKQAGVKVEFKKLKSGFLSVFYRGGFVPDAKAGTAQKTIQKTTQKIMELIKQNPELTRRELAEKIGISDSGIKFSLNQLKKKGAIKRVGPDKGGYWKVIGKK